MFCSLIVSGGDWMSTPLGVLATSGGDFARTASWLSTLNVVQLTSSPPTEFQRRRNYADGSIRLLVPNISVVVVVEVKETK